MPWGFYSEPNTKLIRAFRSRNVYGLEEALKEGANPNLRVGFWRESILSLAIKSRLEKLVKVLIDYGADTKAISRATFIPFLFLLFIALPIGINLLKYLWNNQELLILAGIIIVSIALILGIITNPVALAIFLVTVVPGLFIYFGGWIGFVAYLLLFLIILIITNL